MASWSSSHPHSSLSRRCHPSAATPGHNTVRQRYGAIFSDRTFVGVAIVSSMSFAGLFAYLAASPFLFQEVYGLNAQEYGLLFAMNSIGIVAADSLSLGLLGILIPLWCYITACGFGFPLAQVLALVNHGREAGTAASVLGALNMGMAGLVAPVVGMLGDQDAVPMGAVMAVTAAVAIGALWLVVRPRTVAALVD